VKIGGYVSICPEQVNLGIFRLIRQFMEKPTSWSTQFMRIVRSNPLFLPYSVYVFAKDENVALKTLPTSLCIASKIKSPWFQDAPHGYHQKVMLEKRTWEPW
jgi:hypothetical protein